MDYPKTPELNKLKLIKDKSQTVGNFIEWLYSNGLEICSMHKHDEECYRSHNCKRDLCKRNSKAKCTADSVLDCGLLDEQWIVRHKSIESLLGAFFNIDINKVENEKQAILEYIRTHEGHE